MSLWLTEALIENQNRITHLTSKSAYEDGIKLIKEWSKNTKSINSVTLSHKTSSLSGRDRARILTIWTNSKSYQYQFVVGYTNQSEVVKEYMREGFFKPYLVQEKVPHIGRAVRLDKIYNNINFTSEEVEILYQKPEDEKSTYLRKYNVKEGRKIKATTYVYSYKNHEYEVDCYRNGYNGLSLREQHERAQYNIDEQIRINSIPNRGIPAEEALQNFFKVIGE